MLYKRMIQRISVDVTEFLALLLSLAFLYNQTFPFIQSALLLGYFNAQAVAYCIYSLLLLLFPLSFLWHPTQLDKGFWLRILFYAFSACIFLGAVFDIIEYKGFSGYRYSEGDLIFVNILWNMPNMFGAVFSFAIAALYAVLGKQIRKKRRLSVILFLVIVVLSTAMPFLYTEITTGFLPRATWLKKAAFNIPEQLFMLTAMSIAATSRTLWKEYIWF